MLNLYQGPLDYRILIPRRKLARLSWIKKQRQQSHDTISLSAIFETSEDENLNRKKVNFLILSQDFINFMYNICRVLFVTLKKSSI